MLFGKRFTFIEKREDFEESLWTYIEGAKRDLGSLNTFLQNTWNQDLFRSKFASKLRNITLDEFDFGVSCKVNANGVVQISIGCILAIDSFSSLIASSLKFQPFFINRDFSYLNERFPLFVDYNFLNLIKVEKKEGQYYFNPLFACMRSLPETREGFELWRLTSNMILGNLVSHELGHLTFSHVLDPNLENLSKGYELEADSYYIHKTILDYFNPDFLRGIKHLLSSEESLFYFLCNIVLSVHGLIVGWIKGNSFKDTKIEEKYPNPDVRLINALTSVSSAYLSAQSVNELFKQKINCSIDNGLIIYFLTYAIRNVDWALRVGGKFPLLFYSSMTAEIVNDPTGNLHSRFVVSENLVKTEIKEKLTNYSIKYWLWVNQYNPFQDSNYDTWREIILQLYQKRKSEWEAWSKFTKENLAKDSTLICVSKLYLNCIENIGTENEVDPEWVSGVESFIKKLFEDSYFF